ncbi:MAG: DNA polymerase III subunit delta [Microthrixaceae bacterium]|nr:DNA polymerase III subunit delta [Microthrixaceae bacterium]
MAKTADAPAPAYLLKGSDEVLLSQLVSETVQRLVGPDRGTSLDEFGGDEYTIGDLVLAATTVSMFGERVVLGRNLGRFSSAELEPLLSYLQAPSPDTTLVLVWEKALASGSRLERLPKKLNEAIAAVGGEVHDASIPGGKGRAMWVDDQINDSGINLSRRARQVVIDQLGEDLNRLGSLLSVLRASFGDSEISDDDIAPYLGEAGAVPPWELTDAIDKGQVGVAMDKLRRMTIGGERHSLQIMASLRTHFERMLRLDGTGVRSDKEAAEILGMKGSTFPAKKALAQSERLGTPGLAKAFKLLAAADADLRGRSGQPPEMVMETLVARLASLSGRASRPSAGSRRRAG